ncbi:MAG: CopG family antitoxin [Pyrinomonadaceae bacterium]
MAENKARKLPTSKSLDELVEFFDTQDMGEYLTAMPETHFDVDIKRRVHLVAIDEEIISRISEIAKSKRISEESLVNSWLKEKIAS